MNQYRRRYCILFTLALTVFLGGMCGPAVANASEPDGRETVEATFDLELNQPQSETVYLSDGRTAEIGIRPASAIRPLWDSYYDNASGNWEIYYNSPIIYRHFYITISNHAITNAHSPSYTTFLCTVSGESFNWGSTHATYRLNVDTVGGMGSTVAVIQALMEGTTLHTYAN